MNRYTIFPIGEESFTIDILVKNVRTSPSAESASYWATMVYRLLADLPEPSDPKESKELKEFKKEIVTELDVELNKKGAPKPFVGAVKNLSDSLKRPPILNNYIFKNSIDKVKMWDWIKSFFIDNHQFGYDWFALLRFLVDKEALDKGIEINNISFAKQMNEWYPSLECKPEHIKLYRNGYLGRTRHNLWKKEEFLNNHNKYQREEGFDHLNRLCNTYLTLAFEEEKFYKSI